MHTYTYAYMIYLCITILNKISEKVVNVIMSTNKKN